MVSTSDAASACRSNATIKAPLLFWRRSNRSRTSAIWIEISCSACSQPGAARNALDCAFWDLEAKRSGERVWELANIPIVEEVATSFTISLDTPERMAAAASAAARLPVLKLKLVGDELDLARVETVRAAAPKARLLIDANESWSPQHYQNIVPALSELGVELIEQPFPAANDDVLKTLDHPVPVCADESCHTTADLRTHEKPLRSN